jgi:hypothetical protein
LPPNTRSNASAGIATGWSVPSQALTNKSKLIA